MFFTFFACGAHLWAQKPPIDTSVLGKWPRIEETAISENGEYVIYMINDKRIGRQILVIQSSDAKWKHQILDLSSYSFNGNTLVFLKGNDSLGIVKSGSSSIEYIGGVSSFQLSKNSEPVWLAYQKGTTENGLTLCDLSKEKSMYYPGIAAYQFSPSGKLLVIESFSTKGGDTTLELQEVELITGKKHHIYTGTTNRDFIFDRSESQLAFTANEGGKYAVWQYKDGMDKALRVGQKSLESLSDNWIISDPEMKFANDGQHLLFGLNKVKVNNLPPKTGSSSVIVWNYKGSHLPTEHPDETRFWTALDIQKDTSIYLNKDGERMLGVGDRRDYMLFFNIGLPNGYYNKDHGPYLVLADVKNGTRTMLSQRDEITDCELSPDQHYVTWFDADSLTWYCYEIATSTKRNISKAVVNLLYDNEAVAIGRRKAAFGLGGWESEDKAVFLYDKFDVWKVDPQGLKQPVNITNGYGARKQIVFSVVNFNASNGSAVLSPKAEVLLSGYKRDTKFNGFWKINPDGLHDPLKATMGPYCYYIGRIGAIGHIEYPSGDVPIKAKFANKYVIRRMTAEDYPNLYLTGDFITFQQISDLHPEKEYNWLKAKLVNWKMLDGRMSQGILYQPENFDSTKKYPLIFDYYEKRSDELYRYRDPDFTNARINIPYYVSNGYLVFVPDIYHQPGHNGQGVLNAIISAAKYLSQFPWIDSTKLGIQGHSFGGWETNFLITHTNLFAAACESAGVSDQISGYGQISDGVGTDRQGFYEVSSQGSPFGVGITPWTHPELYAENSPVLYAGNVTTPLLMMHGDRDESVPFAQAMEMFLALRRAGKKVWLLQYGKAGHHLYDANAKDFNIRAKQFFDYYLKDARPPRWMTEEAPISLQGATSGLEFDDSGRKP